MPARIQREPASAVVAFGRVKMNRFVWGVAALIAAGWVTSAQAADLYGSRAPYTVYQPLNAYSWAGPYLGGNLGYTWGTVDNNPTKPSGFEGGGTAGEPLGVRCRGRHRGARRVRHVRAVEVLEPVVRHGTRQGRVCDQQRVVLWHRRSGVRWIARRDVRPGRKPHQCRLG